MPSSQVTRAQKINTFNRFRSPSQTSFNTHVKSSENQCFNAIRIPSTEIPPSMEIFYIPNLSGLNFNQTKDR